LKQAFAERKILLHAANSAGIERFSESAQLDMVRLGIGLYGISAFEKGLEPVGTLKSRIVQIKRLSPGETVGYGRHGRIERPSTIATVPIGYADGLDRRLGRGAWSFRVNGRPAPTVGNICMDTCMIDITGIEAAEGDEVVIFDAAGGVVEMAAVLGTIPYEILTSVSARVKRVYLKE
jgi:alanine racemase